MSDESLADEYQLVEELATSPAKPKGKTEVPTAPDSSSKYHEQMKPGELHIGNRDWVLALIRERQLGYDCSVDKKLTFFTQITLNAGNYRDLVYRTISAVLKRQLWKSRLIVEDEIDQNTEELSQTLANGVCLMTWLKVKSLQSMSVETINKFGNTPDTPTPFEVLNPFAFAISQLGKFEVRGLNDRRILKPGLKMEDARSYLLPANFQWSPTQYSLAVEFCKKIGMEFHSADQAVKFHYSSWWLYKPTNGIGSLELRCPLPQDNFTVDSAVLRSLFVLTSERADRNTIFNLDALGTGEYGSMLRIPHPGINIDVYDAVMPRRY